MSTQFDVVHTTQTPEDKIYPGFNLDRAVILGYLLPFVGMALVEFVLKVIIAAYSFSVTNFVLIYFGLAIVETIATFYFVKYGEKLSSDKSSRSIHYHVEEGYFDAMVRPIWYTTFTLGLLSVVFRHIPVISIIFVMLILLVW